MEVKDWILAIGSAVAFLAFARDWYFKAVELKRLKEAEAEKKKTEAEAKSGKETEKEASVRVRQYETEDRDKDRLEKIATDAQSEVKALQTETRALTREVADLSAKLTITTERYDDLKKDFHEMAAQLQGIREENIRLQTVESQNQELKRELADYKARNEDLTIMCNAAIRGQEKMEGSNSQLRRRVEDLTNKLKDADPTWHGNGYENPDTPFLASVTVTPAAAVAPAPEKP